MSLYAIFGGFLVAVVVQFSLIAAGHQQGTKLVAVSSDYFYELNYDALTYTQAEDQCEENDGILAAIKDYPTLAIITKNMFDGSSPSAILNESRNVSEFFWIGLEQQESGNWKFADGKRYRSQFTFAPSDKKNSSDDKRKCAGIVTSGLRASTWLKEDCTRVHPYICQYDNSPCAPNAVIDARASDNRDLIFGPCDAEVAREQRERMINDCTCPSGHVVHDLDEVFCNSKNWYRRSICVPGCSPVKTSSSSFTLDSQDSYWLGSSVTVICFQKHDTNHRMAYQHHATLTCKEGGLWAGENNDVMCLDLRDSQQDPQSEILNHLVRKGQNVSLKCDYLGMKLGIAADSWLWLRNDRDLNVSGSSEPFTNTGTRYRINDKEGGTLEIVNFSGNAEGSYMCFARYKNAFLPGRLHYVSEVLQHSQVSSGQRAKAHFGFSLDIRLLVVLFVVKTRFYL